MSLSIRMLGLYALYPLLEVHAKNGGSNSIRGRSGTGVVEGKGGNGGTSEEEKVVHTDGLSWWGILLLTLAIVIFIFIIVKCCVEFQDAYFGGGRKVCYLCLDKIRIQDWNSGEHRRQCAFRYASDLTNLLQHDRVKCPKCESRLRLWPEGRGPSFSCDSDDSLECADKGSQIKNNGKNRYNCFLCDYDLCESCVQKRSEKLEKSDCISVHWSNHGSSRKSSSSEFAQDGTIRIDFVNDGKRRYSKDTHSNDQRRFSHEIRKEARRPSHAGSNRSRPDSRRPSKEQENGEPRAELYARHKNGHRRESYQPHRPDKNLRRKSHADLLVPTSQSRRYSQVDVNVNGIPIFNEGHMYSSHNKERRVRSKETVREERRGSRDRVFKEEEGRRNSRDQLIDGGERRGSRDLRNSRDHLHASKEQLKESLKATVLLDPYQKSGSRHGSSEKLLGSMQPKIMDEFDTGNENTDTESSLSKPDREVSHQEQTYSGVYSEDDSGQHGNNIRSSENQKLANQPLNSTDLKLYKKNPPKVSGTLPRISGTPSNSLDVKEDGNLAFLARRHKQRRSSLLPTETERTYPIANQRRRNSSTVLIISPPSNPDCSPIFINKEDGLARY